MSGSLNRKTKELVGKTCSRKTKRLSAKTRQASRERNRQEEEEEEKKSLVI